MAYLDWYRTLDEKTRRRAYELAWFLCPRGELVVERIIPDAVDFVHKSARWNAGRQRRITFLDLQLFQLAILHAAEEAGQRLPLTPVRSWVWYISHLAWCTVLHSSFATLVGFAGLLSNGSAAQCVELYNYLDPPDVDGHKTGGTRIPLDGRRALTDLQQQMYARFRPLFQTDGQALELQATPKQAGNQDEIHNILKRMLLWETEHVPDTYPAYCAEQQRRQIGARIAELERTRAHVGIDQEQCLERVKSWNNRFSAIFDIWRLPLLHPGLPSAPDGNASKDGPTPNDDPWRPPDMSHWDEIDKRIQKEILWKEHEEQAQQKSAKTNHRQASTFEVVVDGTVQDVLNRRKPSSEKIVLPSSARYVEIRDRERRATVANCHLMDPQDLPQKGWKSSVRLPSGGNVKFAFFPEPVQDDRGTSIAMLVKLPSSPLLTLLGSGVARVWQAVQLETAPVQRLTSLASTPGRGWRAGWSALERAWRRFQAQSLGYRTIMAGMAIAAILVGSFVLQPSRVSEAEARSAIYAALPKVVEARTHLKEAPTRQEVEIVAQQVEVRLIHVNGVTLPWPTLSPETANVTAISEGLRQFPSLQRVYHDYLAQWIELFPHVDEGLSDSNLSGAIQVFEYLRHVSPYDRDKSLRFSLGELYKLRGKDDDNSHRQAIAVYDDMIAWGMAAGDPRPWHYAGWSFFKLHEYDRALEYYEQALSLLPPNAPTSAKLLYNKALAYEAKGGLSTEDHRRLVDNNIQRALDITLAADQCEGRVNVRVPFTLAVLFTVTREPATALQYLARAVQQEPIYVVVRADYEPAFEFFRNPAHEPYHTEFLDLLKQYRTHAQGRRAERGEEPFNPCIFWE